MNEGEELPVPSDRETERSLLSTLAAPGATGGTRLDDLILALNPAIFFFGDTRPVCRALQALVGRHVEVSLAPLCAQLQAQGDLEKVGGHPGLLELLDGEEVAHPEVLIGILQEQLARREAMKAGADLVRKASDPTVSFADTKTDFRTRLEIIEGQGGVQELPPLREIDAAGWLEAEPPPVAYILEDIIPLGEPTILAAKSNAGKSLIALELGVAVATGRGLWGRQGPPCPMHVLFVEMEDAEPEVWRRYKRCVSLMREEPDWTEADNKLLRVNWHPFVPEWRSRLPKNLVSLIPHILGKVKQMTAAGVPIGLIVLDTFAALSPGKENDAEVHAPFWAACYQLRDMTGATVLVVHHYKKLGDSLGLFDRLSFDNVRGSTAIVAGAQAVVQGEPLTTKEAGRVSLDEARAAAGNYLALMLTKFKAGSKGSCLLLEQRQAGDNGAGFFTLHPDSERICATLRSKNEVAKLDKAEAVLLDLVDGLDRKTIAAKHWPEDKLTDKQRDGRLRDLIYRLKKTHKWLQPDGRTPNSRGFEKIQELRRAQGEAPDAQEQGGVSWPTSA